MSGNENDPALTPNEKFLAHFESCDRCRNWLVSWGMCPEANALLEAASDTAAAAIFPMPKPAVQA